MKKASIVAATVGAMVICGLSFWIGRETPRYQILSLSIPPETAVGETIFYTRFGTRGSVCPFGPYDEYRGRTVPEGVFYLVMQTEQRPPEILSIRRFYSFSGDRGERATVELASLLLDGFPRGCSQFESGSSLRISIQSVQVIADRRLFQLSVVVMN